MEISKGKALSDNVITSVVTGYRQHLKKNLIHIMGDKLVLFTLVNMQSKYVCLTILPQALRMKLFSHYHTGPSGGQMGAYKTLFRLRLRFFWTTMRDDIKLCVKYCAHCVAYAI